MHVLGAALTAEEKNLLAQAAKERADIIDRYDKVIQQFVIEYKKYVLWNVYLPNAMNPKVQTCKGLNRLHIAYRYLLYAQIPQIRDILRETLASGDLDV